MTLTTEWQMVAQALLGNSYGNVYIRTYARCISQDEINLTSTVQYQARIYYSGSSWILDGGGYGTISGSGATSAGFTATQQYPSGETPLETITGTVTHDQDTGEASITTSAALVYPNWSWSATASGSANLPTIDVSTLRLRVNGNWVKAKPYLRVNGAWKQCKAYLRVSGNWKKGV